MSEYYKQYQLQTQNLSQIELPMNYLQQEINDLAYKCYNLCEDDISRIENFIKIQSKHVLRSF
jgi:hypothetical protein